MSDSKVPTFDLRGSGRALEAVPQAGTGGGGDRGNGGAGPGDGRRSFTGGWQPGAGIDPTAFPSASVFRGVMPARVVAFILDMTIIGILWAVLLVPSIFLGLLTFGFLFIVLPISMPLLWLTYVAVTIGGAGSATPGMRIMGIEVRRADGGRPNWVQALVLVGLFMLSVPTTGGLALAAMLLTQANRALHDILAGTVVVNRAGT
ncbi:MAG: RDD family protein [Alphaproteobacteria bacterium]|nr:RDD family protein [Alphaproteobacteria bacterium]